MSRGCVDDTCSSTTAELSEWNVTALYYSTEPGLEPDAENTSAQADMDLIAGWHYYDCQTVSSQEELFYPKEFDLKQNYPNPFNPVTNIAIDITRRGNPTIHYKYGETSAHILSMYLFSIVFNLVHENLETLRGSNLKEIDKREEIIIPEFS